MQSAQEWAETEFGGAELGDARRTRRLVCLAAEVAQQPAGTVTRACASSASREGAFRLLENTAVSPDAVLEPQLRATAERCCQHRRVVVAVDASALTITDEKRQKGIGSIGTCHQGARGVHAMSALAIAEDGATIGLCGQRMWVRAERSPHGDRRVRDKANETSHWLEVIVGSRALLQQEAPRCEPWFQLDRGGDCWQVLALAHQLNLLLTVRASHDRRIEGTDAHLWDMVGRARVVARQRIHVRARPPRQRKKRVGGRRRVHIEVRRDQSRIAKVEIRATKLPVMPRLPSGRCFTVPLHAVLVREVNGPTGDALEWMLLTTHPIDTRAQVLEVVRAYCLRWRVEEFHRVWKRGLCRVEDTQLRSRNAIYKWAIVLAAVATRAMRLTQLARTTPDVPATSELSELEIEALVALRQPKAFKQGEMPTLGQAVRWLADLGGYTGPWNGPPGATVIGRGLHDVLIAARAFENRDKKR